MAESKKYFAITAAILLIIFTTGCSLMGGFDASGYVKATLNQNLKGDVKEAKTRMEGVTEKELRNQYNARVKSFVDQTLISGVEIEDQLQTQYTELSKQIFKNLKYEVKEEKKINSSKYQVDVELQPVDVFQTFQAAVQADSEKIVVKAQNGEYKGTEDEISKQMEREFVEQAYQILVTSYDNMKYGKKETFTFHVTRKDEEAFGITEKELSSFILKILQMDEIQD